MKDYRIDWDAPRSTWWAVSYKYPQIHARHTSKLGCIGLLKSRVDHFDNMCWLVNHTTASGYKVHIFSIEDIHIDLGPKLIYVRLNECDLESQPREELIKLLKELDAKVERRSAVDFAWYDPWVYLIQYLDPLALLKFPNPDWSLIDEPQAFVDVERGYLT